MYKKFLNQNYDELREKCLKSAQLFEDDLFPASKASISNKTNDGEELVWKRPHEIIQDPVFITDDFKTSLLQQGELGDCWVISAIAGLCMHDENFYKVVPKDQSFTHKYAGIFRFRFWHYGEWIEVVVDDRLPTRNECLVYSRNTKNLKEMYGPLLEKAYAKLNRCYFNLISGEINDSLTDFTGGLHENFHLKDINNLENLWKNILRSFEMKSMAGCAIDLPKEANTDFFLENKLRTGHTYSVLSAHEISKTRLLRLRNPWGHEISWSGKWANDSKEWDNVAQNLKNKLKFPSNDGQFFISLEDFVKNFDNLDFVHTNLEIFDVGEWKCQILSGEWKQGINSGGSSNAGKQSFFSNPKYLLDLSSQTESQKIIISLMQTDGLKMREKIGRLKGSREALGVQIYRLKNGRILNDSNIEFVDNTGVYIYKREINKMFKLNPGVYLIIPSCFKKDVNMKFMMRIFCLQEIKVEEFSGKYQNEAIKLNSTNSQTQSSKNKKETKIIRKSYITDTERDKNKNIGMHLTKLDHEDFSQACCLM